VPSLTAQALHSLTDFFRAFLDLFRSIFGENRASSVAVLLAWKAAGLPTET
jgi:hypothetical protein